ncbi:MAG: hypothetical protein PHH26_08210 [Candidatus Thermoplasmatota archaeon]|nr:hypothetical protein [Candidatus Thermoplasmatota archaeon]
MAHERAIRLPAKETQALAEICYNLRSQGADFTAELDNFLTSS